MKFNANIAFVEKRDFSSFSYLDSQRIENTFFIPQRKKLFSKKLIFLVFPIFLLLFIFFFLSKYEFLIIPRINYNTHKNDISLIKDGIASINFLNKNSPLIKKKKSFIYLPIPYKEKIGISFDFKKPIDLTKSYLYLILEKIESPFKIDVIVRDWRFFSNSLNPLIIEFNKTKSFPKRILINLENSSLQNTNLSKINQIKLYFYYPKEEKIISEDKGNILIKDIILVKKEEGR
jgi:hypothetical protein